MTWSTSGCPAAAAGRMDAKVEQCYLCHQTTSWNDSKAVGHYKQH